jgi:catechol 2,3-dioxygenase-like lactoylglutathione lyase family enzyme
MNRLHVHLHVHDIAQSVRFYTTLFGAAPSKREDDYAKWMLDDPHVNFAISARGGDAGLGHLGIQVESETALAEASARARDAAGTVAVEKNAQCCYAISDKAWATDPQGVRWETFHTTDDLAEFGDDVSVAAAEPKSIDAASPSPSACCGTARG